MPAVGVFLFLSGCQAIKADFTRSGGTVGYYADDLLPGATKELQFYRATVAYALFSTLGARLASGPDQIFATLRYMVAVRHDLNNLGGHLWPSAATGSNPIGPCQTVRQDPAKVCAGYRATFEYDLPTLEGNLYKLAVSALPAQALTSVAKDLSTFNWIGVVRGLISSGGELVAGAHNLGAAWRSEREIFAELVDSKQTGTDDGKPKPDSVQAALERIATLDDSAGNRDFGKYANMKNRPNASPSGEIDALYWMVRQSCRRMLARLSDDDALKNLLFVEPSGENTAKKMRDAACKSFVLQPNAQS